MLSTRRLRTDLPVGDAIAETDDHGTAFFRAIAVAPYSLDANNSQQRPQLSLQNASRMPPNAAIGGAGLMKRGSTGAPLVGMPGAPTPDGSPKMA